MFYVCEGQIPSAMPRSKCSCQRIAYRSHLIYTNERKDCLLTTQLQKKEWCQHQLTNLLYRTLFRLSAPFLKIFKFFHRKRQPRFTELSPLKSLAIIHHIILTLLRVCRSKNHITACFYIIIFIFFSQIKRQPNSGCLLVYLFILR